MNKIILKTIVIFTVAIFTLSIFSFSEPKENNAFVNETKSHKLNGVISKLGSTNTRQKNHIRIMSYNILADSLGFEGTEADLRADGVCSILNTLSPDVTGLQEVSRNWRTCIEKNTTYSFISPLRTQLFGTMTTLIYNKETLTLLESGEIAYRHGYDSRLRRLVWGLFLHKRENKSFLVINTHFSLSNNNTATPMNQAKELMETGRMLHQKFGCPVFFIGDFNARERSYNTNISSAVYEKLCTELSDTKTNAVSTSYGTNQSVYSSSNDHIFLMGEAEILKYVILSQKEFSSLSDHYPIFIDTVI